MSLSDFVHHPRQWTASGHRTVEALNSLSDYYRRITEPRTSRHPLRDKLSAIQVLAMIEETLNPNSDEWV